MDISLSLPMYYQLADHTTWKFSWLCTAAFIFSLFDYLLFMLYLYCSLPYTRIHYMDVSFSLPVCCQFVDHTAWKSSWSDYVLHHRFKIYSESWRRENTHVSVSTNYSLIHLILPFYFPLNFNYKHSLLCRFLQLVDPYVHTPPVQLFLTTSKEELIFFCSD